MGYFDSGEKVYTGIATKGSLIRGIYLYTYQGSSTYLFDTSVDSQATFYGALFARDVSFNMLNGVFALFQSDAGEESKLYDVFINGGAINLAGTVLDMANIFSNARSSGVGAIYFIYSAGDATVWNFITDDDYDTIGGFASIGLKTFINCKIPATSFVYLSSHTQYNIKTFDANIKDELGNPIPNAQVKVNYRLASTANVFTVLTDANGDIEQQFVNFGIYICDLGGGVFTPTRDIEYFVTKSGYKELSGRINIQNRDDPIDLELVMKKNRYREDRSV
jgi:hypothetical protein